MAPKPISAKCVLDDDHGKADEYGIGDAHKAIAAKSIAAEDETTDDGLQKVVGETHAAKEAKVTEHAAHTLEHIPCRDHRCDDGYQDEQVVDGGEPRGQISKIDNTQNDDNECRNAKDDMPPMQVTPLVVEEPVTPQLHAEDEQAEQLGESTAEDVEPQVQFEPISEIVYGILPKCAIFMQTDGFVVYLKERGVVNLRSRKQTEQFYWLDGQQANDAPDNSRWQKTDGDEQQSIDCIKHQNVTIVESNVDKAKDKQQAHAPGKTAGKRLPLLLLVVVHDEEAQSEEHGEDAIHLATQ